MYISSSNIRMGSTRTYVEADQKTEEVDMWIGRRRPTTDNDRDPPKSRDIKDRVTFGSVPPPPPNPYRKAKCDGSRVDGECQETTDDEESLIGSDLYILKQFIESLTGHKIKIFNPSKLQDSSSPPDAPPEQAPEGARAQGEQGWGFAYDRTESHYESEQTAFSADGVIKTADGKEINFSLQLQMSREFLETSSESIRAGDAVQKTDPLVINYAGTAAQLTDMQFAFDLDTDGETENISFVRPGSGFLVLDKNQDGVVNNGSELFGPSTGSGLAELAAYDADKNNWIDENDPIYNQLGVWTKDESGNDQLSSLKEASVGAIYLSQMQTPFDLKDENNQLRGQVASTGIYADEDGTVKTVQQVDLVM